MTKHRKAMIARAGLFGAVASWLLSGGAASAEEFFKFEGGELQRPTGYREWVYVGTPLTPNDMNDGKAGFPEFHSVYIDPASWAHWKKTGEFREEAILMKEMITVGSKSAASGEGYFMGDFHGLEATIKSKKLFPKEPGNWAYFTFTTDDHQTLEKSAAPEPASVCNSCHAEIAADDWVFTQYYPVLRGAKGKGEEGTGGKQDKLEHLSMPAR